MYGGKVLLSRSMATMIPKVKKKDSSPTCFDALFS